MAVSHSNHSLRPSLTRVAALAAAIALGILGTFGIVVGMALGNATPVFAHAAVVESTPANGQTLTELPEKFSVTANEPLLDVTGSAAGFALQIVDATGLHYEQTCPEVAGATLAVGAAIGEPGAYQLRYQFVSADGHSVSGAIDFDWAPVGEHTVTKGAAQSPCGATSTPTAPAESASPTAESSASPSEDIVTQQPAQEAGGSDFGIWIGIGIATLVGIVAVILAAIALATRRHNRNT